MTDIKDAVVVGGGIAGLAFLKYAREARLEAVLIEKEPDVGGLWRRLPEWQDIQIRPEDWSVNGLPIHGVDQKSVHANIKAWVSRYGLSPSLRLGEAVTGARREGEAWVVTTDKGQYRARNLIVASGLHNDPFIPPIVREQSRVQEFHSSRLRNKSVLAGKRVAVQGGSASAWDLLELALAQGAREIHWIYRSARWMIPSTKPKHVRSDIRTLAFNQFWKGSIDDISKRMQSTLEDRYKYFGLNEILPKGNFHFDRDVLVGGRPLMIREFDKLHRHFGEIDRIEGQRIFVGKESFEADILLHATGFRLNLRYLNLPGVSELTTMKELSGRSSFRVKSLDYPNLYFMGIAFHDSNTSVPFMVSVLAKSIVSAIRGNFQFPDEVVPQSITHWDLIKRLARHDHYTYPLGWKLKYKFLSRWYKWRSERQVHV